MDRYVRNKEDITMDKEISVLIDETYAMAHVLSLLFEQVENNDIKVNPHAVARIGEMMTSNIMQISQFFHDNPPTV